jgi:serine/threonine protein kinase
MVIEGTNLAYYKKENRKEKAGSIPLMNTTVELVPEYKKNKHAFQIVTPGRTYVMVGTSDADVEHWIKCIKEAQNPKGKTVNPIPQTPVNAADSDEDSDAGRTPTVEDFDLLRVIGKGSFGKVLLVRHKESGKIFAMKVLNKQTIVERNEVEHTKSEKSILMKLRFPFLVGLHYSFQTPDKLYFIMDYINGGELFFHLQKEKKFSEERVRFYAAEIAAGLEYLHNAGVIYRDLKPENLLLTNEGHIVMTDFGLSKEGLLDKDDRTGTFCGTPEYLAPEVLEGKGYGKAVDWWSFGTLVYEMLTGLPPFYSEDVQHMYTKIMTAELEIPDTMSPEAGDLLSKLLDRDPESRLQEPREIKRHPFFAPLDFDKLIAKQIRPPWIPETNGEADTSNIDSAFLEEPVTIDDMDDGPTSSHAATAFEGFTYQGAGQH